MTDNHNHAFEEVLAGTVPQARPEFQQALEEQLVLTLQEQTHLEIKPMHIDTHNDKPKRMPRGLPVSLAATIAMILFGGLAALVATGSLANAPIFSGAALDQEAQVPADIASTATAIILQATYQPVEAQMQTAQAQLDSLARQATELAAAANPDSAMTSIVQTATAVIEQATARAGGQALLMPSLVPTGTPIGSAFATVVPVTSCPPQKLVVYSAPGAQNPVITAIDPLAADKFQVQGLLTLHETGEDWFYVTFAHEGQPAQGWVQAAAMRAPCDDLPGAVITQMLPPTVVPSMSMQIMVTPTAAPILPTVPPPLFTPTPLSMSGVGPQPAVEHMADGSYQITLPVAEEPKSAIKPGDAVYVLAEMRYGVDRRAWTVVAQDTQVIALLEPSANAYPDGSFRWMDVVLASRDEATVTLLQDMAAAGIRFSLERAS
jgi:hypothetical protein